MRRSLVLSFLTLALAPLARAAAPPVPPPDVSRTLRTFDFEERRLGNLEDLPMSWVKVEGANLPHYVNGRLATGRARSGQYAFRFDLDGGGLSYRYDATQIRVRNGAHYRVETYCQTTVLPRARARLTAFFTDLDGHPLRDMVRHSALYAAAADDEPWKRLAVELTADERAAYLVVELGLLQPQHYTVPGALGERTLLTQDIRGSAWFDDVSVSQVPRVRLRTEHPGNLFKRGEPLRLKVFVNDRFVEDLAAQLVVRDAEGKTVYQRSGALDLAAARDLGPGRREMTVELPALPPGWYDAALLMSSRGQYVGEESLHLIHLSDDKPASRPDGRFGLIATSLPPQGWDDLPDLLPMLSAGRVKLAVWSAEGDVDDLPAGAFDQLLERLQLRGITPTACLLDLPPRLAEKLAPPRRPEAYIGGWGRLIDGDPAVWQPELAYLVSRHANHLDRWQLGPDGTDAFVTRPAMRAVYDRLYAEFATLVEQPDLAMPWPAWYDLEGGGGGAKMPATVALAVPASVLPAQLPLYIHDVNACAAAAARDAAGRNRLSLTLQPLDVARHGRMTQIRDLAQRVVYALAAGATRIDLPLPFEVQRRGDDVVQQPAELMIILRTLTTTLSGARYMGKVPIAEGIDAFLFDRDGQGIVALWDRDASRASAGGQPAAPRQLALNLGPRPVSVDLWGNVTPLLNAGGGKGDGKVTVAVGPVPIFLVDIDGFAAQLRASVAIDRPLLESNFMPHARKFRFTNTYKQSISGNVRLKAPPGWTLNPPTFAFNLNPGEVFEKDLTIEFPYNSFAGPKTLSADFAVQGESAFTVPVTLNLGLSDVGMQTIALRDGADVIVQQQITNYGEKPIDYNAFAIFPGQARQERLVTNLAPGRTTIKKYRFQNVKPLADVKVRAGMKEMEGTRVLNEEVPIQ
jgi:hypothetical protein